MFDFKSLQIDRVETLIDVGAGTGAFLSPAICFYHPTTTVAIEMLPDRADHLRRSFPKTTIHENAVGEWRGTAIIRRTRSADSSSLLIIDPRAQDWYGLPMLQSDSGNVEMRTLDELCSPFEQIDLLKLDIQGYEAKAIRGAGQTLIRTKALLVELLYCHHYEGQALPEEVDELLESLGFQRTKLLNPMYGPDGRFLLQADAFYVNANL